jgi:RNA polymerase sigma-70 factor (ECF subfamily)
MHPTNFSNQKLMQLLANGSQRAFELVYDRYWKDLYRLAVRILQDDAKAEDVVQEVFVSFYENGDKKQIVNLKAYLYQSARYQCFMQLRAGKITAKHLERMSKVIFSNIVEEEFEAQEMEQILEKGISALPEKCREVFYLSRVELLSNKTIATQLKISPKTVENQITKALKTLRATVEQSTVLLFLFIL